ncbi:MAG: translocation protein TolB [Alcanivoracaceae bacterium]|nr:translocation protein TolB [Alcanivoracaceae bacterium]
MSQKTTLSRRDLLKHGTRGLAVLAVGPSLLAISQPLSARTLTEVGPLQAPDSNGIRLPQGFSSRIVAAAGQRVRRSFWNRTRYHWHSYPDGGATFATDDGGWVYVSNSETINLLGGGAGAIRFHADGSVNDAYRILGGTNLNCAGGLTPWHTWLSCEETDFGRVYECDPLGQKAAQLRRGLGYFKHEAAAVDPVFNMVYLTEDEGDGRFYRFIPAGVNQDGSLNLDEGVLQAAAVDEQGYVSWLDVPNPNPRLLQTPTREQLPQSTAFDGGEGCWYSHGQVYFTTKGDNKVWQLDTNLNQLTVIYDAATAANPILTGVDNLTVSGGGDVLVAEDGGDMQIVVIDKQGEVAPLIQVTGQDDSEITGPAFSPDGTRLYFSSQRGSDLFGGGNGFGITYEITGPFQQFVTL